MDAISVEELIMTVRRQSQGFSRGSSSYRGVTFHPSGAGILPGDGSKKGGCPVQSPSTTSLRHLLRCTTEGSHVTLACNPLSSPPFQRCSCGVLPCTQRAPSDCMQLHGVDRNVGAALFMQRLM